MRVHQRVLARALGNAPPARVLADVHHRRIGQIDAVIGGLFCAHARGLLPQLIVKCAAFCQRNGRNGAIAVNDIAPKQNRDSESGLFNRNLLQAARCLAPDCGVHSHATRADIRLAIIRLGQTQLFQFFLRDNALTQLLNQNGFRRIKCAVYGRTDQNQLTDLFLKRHLRKQGFDLFVVILFHCVPPFISHENGLAGRFALL